MENNVNEIITYALKSKRINNISNETKIIEQLKKVINENSILLKTTNQIDLKNNNGFELDINVLNKIIDKYINVEPLINKNNEINILKNNMIYSKVYNKLGIILALFDGNTYTMLELIILGILTHNTFIFSYTKNMLGTNGLIITFIQTVLEQNNYDKYMFQHTIDINNEEYFKQFKTIDKTIIIGDNDFITKNLKLCTTDVLVSGYNNYDIYIEDVIDENIVNKILLQKNINIYIKDSIFLKNDNAIYVNDCDEAITQINYNSSKYSSSIFTKSNESASKFVREINSKFVFVNTSPTLEQSLNILEEDLLKEKNILVPNVNN